MHFEMSVYYYIIVCCIQRRCRADGDIHRDRRDARPDPARADAGRVWSRDVPACPAELHGADRGPVRVHLRRAA